MTTLHPNGTHTPYSAAAELSPNLDDAGLGRDAPRRQPPTAVLVEAKTPGRGFAACIGLLSGLFALLLAAAAAAAGVALAAQTGAYDNGDGKPFFPSLGRGIDGGIVRGEFGASVSISGEGTVLAIANVDAVYVYRLAQQEEEEQDEEEKHADQKMVMQWTTEPEIIKPTNCGVPSISHDEIRSNLVVDVSHSGKYVTIGCPFSSNQNGTVKHTGRVELYQDDGGSWGLMGDAIYGDIAYGYFGSSVSLSGGGRTVAIGYAAGVRVMRFNLGYWIPVGNELGGTELLLTVSTVSLDQRGEILAVGGAALSGGDAVVRSFRFDTGEWMELGSGIEGKLGEGIVYVCDLSSNGKVLAVSNYYAGDGGAAEGTALNDALDARVFSWDDDSGEWQPTGQNLHGNAPGEKSGYFITLNEEETLLGVGDPGRRSEEDDGSSGHVHVYWYDQNSGAWQQLGPDKYGENVGDQFGYAVALSADGNRFAVTAPKYESENGRVYVYDISGS